MGVTNAQWKDAYNTLKAQTDATIAAKDREITRLMGLAYGTSGDNLYVYAIEYKGDWTHPTLFGKLFFATTKQAEDYINREFSFMSNQLSVAPLLKME